MNIFSYFLHRKTYYLNGYLLTDVRKYSGITDIEILNVKIVNDIGKPVDFNGLDFSFCLEVVHE